MSKSFSLLCLWQESSRQAAPAPCLNSADELVEGSMVREADNEYECRGADDIELTARRIDTDSFFAPR